MIRAALLALFCVAFAAAGALAQQSTVPSSGNALVTPMPSPGRPGAGDVAQGRQLFDVHCASCHGLNLQGSALAPPLINSDAGDVDFMLETGRMPAEVPWEQEFQKPPIFSRRQINSIVSYVSSRSTGEKTLPPVVASTDVEKGREIFAENCQQCHAATAHGNSVGYGNVAPSLMDSSPQQIAEAVRMGPDVMPKFGTGVIDDKNLGALIAYVQWLQRAKYNPGGLQLANWGPVSEGFMAWVFGIGLLVLLVRRIGTTE